MISFKNWHIPLSHDKMSLHAALKDLSTVKAQQQEIPLMVKLVENPKFNMPGFEIFHGAVDLQQHDCIHILLGRGLLSMDEAFTIGFTMGTTNKVSTTEEKLYALIAKYFYPETYQFNESDIEVFKNAVRLGYISSAEALDQVDFSIYMSMPLHLIRDKLGLELVLLKAYYYIEKNRYPNSVASQRLLVD